MKTNLSQINTDTCMLFSQRVSLVSMASEFRVYFCHFFEPLTLSGENIANVSWLCPPVLNIRPNLGVRSNAGGMTILGNCVKGELRPGIPFWFRVGLNDADLRPLLWNMMRKIIGKISVPKNCSPASISLPYENFQIKYFFFLVPSLCLIA